MYCFQTAILPPGDQKQGSVHNNPHTCVQTGQSAEPWYLCDPTTESEYQNTKSRGSDENCSGIGTKTPRLAAIVRRVFGFYEEGLDIAPNKNSFPPPAEVATTA
jgi:hypothetical protein